MQHTLTFESDRLPIETWRGDEPGGVFPTRAAAVEWARLVLDDLGRWDLADEVRKAHAFHRSGHVIRRSEHGVTVTIAPVAEEVAG